VVLIWGVVLFAPLVCILDCHLRVHTVPALRSVFVCDLRAQAGSMPTQAPTSTILPTIVYDALIPILCWGVLLGCLMMLLVQKPTARAQYTHAPLTPPPRSA
jgi:hypothetical protein